MNSQNRFLLCAGDKVIDGFLKPRHVVTNCPVWSKSADGLHFARSRSFSDRNVFSVEQDALIWRVAPREDTPHEKDLVGDTGSGCVPGCVVVAQCYVSPLCRFILIVILVNITALRRPAVAA